jgi:hypothetical protein
MAMANRQAASETSRKGSAGGRSGSGERGRSQSGESATGERDEHYNVISVLYHALQGAETIQKYVQDARGSSDKELLEFFEETRLEYVARAAQAKELLASRLEGMIGESDDEEEEEED